MRPLIISFVALALMYGAAALAVRLRSALPQHHLDEAAKDMVSRGTGFVVTLAALVLSLLIAAGKTSQDEFDGKLRLLATQFVLLDRDLANYGPETTQIRDLLRRTMASAMLSIWPDAEWRGPALNGELPRFAIERVQRMIVQLKPANEIQRVLQSNALEEMNEIRHTGWLLIELREARMPSIFLVVLILWLLIVFFGFGLFAPRTRMVHAGLLFWAFCAAGAIFLILELYSPVSGMLAISPRTFQLPLEHMER